MNRQDAALPLARSRVYRLLSAVCGYPDEKGWAGLDWEGAREALGALDQTGALASSLAGAAQELEALRDRVGSRSARAGALPDLAAEHTAVFGHSVAKDCPAYETLWGSPHVFMQTQELADISGFYRAWGVDLADNAKERVDHLSVELEFMSYLAAKEAYAAQKADEEHRVLCRDAQAKFLGEHLGRWVPNFAGMLETISKEGGYCRPLARLLMGWVAEDVRMMGARVEPAPAEPRAALDPEDCSSCGLVDDPLRAAGATEVNP